MKHKLGILTSHPIQYYSPLFRFLAKELDLVVFYCHQPTPEEIGGPGFGKSFEWDIDLMGGSESVFVPNISKKPSLNTFQGCDNPALKTYFKTYQITHLIIFGWYLKAFIQGLIYAKQLGIKVGVRGDSQLNPTGSKIKHFIKKLFYPILLHRYDNLFYVGERNRKYLIAYGAKKDKLIFSPHAVDHSFWKIPEGFIKPSNKNVQFVWVGKFVANKRPLEAINAFILASTEFPNMELTMIGDGPLMTICREAAKISTKIHFKGFLNQNPLKLELLSKDVLILNSIRETWGLVVNECYGLGIPAIITNGCGCKEDLILDSNQTITMTKNHIKDLSAKIIEFYASKVTNQDFLELIEKKNNIYSFQNILNSFLTFTKL